MVRVLSRVIGIGVETADLPVQEILLRDLRNRRAVARYAGLTGSPDESGARRRERGLSRAGNARVRKAMVQLAWRFLVFQKESALVKWHRERTADGRGRTRMALIVALARKLLIALWRMVKTGEVPKGALVRPDPAAQLWTGRRLTAFAWPSWRVRGGGSPVHDMVFVPLSR